MNEKRQKKRIPICRRGRLTNNDFPNDTITIKITDVTIDGMGVRFYTNNALRIGQEFNIAYPYPKHEVSFPVKIIWKKENCSGYFFGCHKI